MNTNFENEIWETFLKERPFQVLCKFKKLI